MARHSLSQVWRLLHRLGSLPSRCTLPACELSQPAPQMPAKGTMHGEFENSDPIGLSAGVTIKADCSINWVDPDSGKRYCFSSATSLIVFLDAPHSYLARALKNWDRINTVASP